MSMTVRELMKKSGITLKDVSSDVEVPVPVVCRLLNDELVKKVRDSAMGLIVSRSQENANIAASMGNHG